MTDDDYVISESFHVEWWDSKYNQKRIFSLFGDAKVQVKRFVEGRVIIHYTRGDAVLVSSPKIARYVILADFPGLEQFNLGNSMYKLERLFNIPRENFDRYIWKEDELKRHRDRQFLESLYED